MGKKGTSSFGASCKDSIQGVSLEKRKGRIERRKIWHFVASSEELLLEEKGAGLGLFRA